LSVDPLIEFAAAPFHIGFRAQPSNPAPFPDLLPLCLGVDIATGLLRQLPREDLRCHLALAHERGALLGTAMDDTQAGRAYAEDFLNFVDKAAPIAGSAVLEIGAGRGYLVKRLQDAGAEALGIEPGRANAPHWARHGVSIIEDSFPTAKIAETFDLVLAYTLLQQIEDPVSFLDAVRRRLKPGGLAVFAVPDCSVYIADGDPGMLLHDIWSYFTPATLRHLLQSAGFAVRRLQQARHGGVIYAAAAPSAAPDPTPAADLAAVRQFALKCRALRAGIARRIERLAAAGRSLGLYAPGRAMLWLEPAADVRFFDDDPELWGRYFPPFAAAVESRQSLLDRPVDELWIMSRSFGARIEKALRAETALEATRLMRIEALLE